MVGLSDIGDAFSSVAEGVAKPLATFGIGGQQGNGFSLSGLLDSLGKAGSDIVQNSTLGIAAQTPRMVQGVADAFGGANDQPLWQKVGEGALAGAGILAMGKAHLGGNPMEEMAASHMHATSMEAPFPSETAGMQAPRLPQYEGELAHAESMGLTRQTTRFSPQVEQLYPGIRRESNWILGANDPVETVAGIARWSTSDPMHLEKTAAAAGIVTELGNRIDQYAPDATKLRYAQMYLAKSDYVNDAGLLGSLSGDNRSLLPGTSEFKRLYAKFTKDPHLLKPEEADRLVGFMHDIGSATEKVNSPDFQFDPLVRLSGVELDQTGPVFYFSRPQWDDSIFTPDSTERIARLKQLNYRPLYERGVYHVRTLLDVAKMDADQRAIGSYGILPKPNELGANWYPDAHAVIDSVRGDLSMDKATALVSLTSAAEDWRTNVDKAMQAAPYLNHPAVQDEGFQGFLRGEKSGNDIQHQSTLAGIQQQLTQQGMMYDTPSVKKVLRLANESPEDIFATTNGLKQKNFYLNLLHPEYQLPVTIDRHAYDSFLGMDTGVDWRPVDQSLEYGGEKVYDLIAQAYRQVAQERGLKPHEVQAVAWETWKQLKNEHNALTGYKGVSWVKGDPFRLGGPNGEPNLAFDALRGASGVDAEGIAKLVPADTVPIVLAGSRPAGRRYGVQTTVDGSVAVLAPPTAASDGVFRNLYPEFVSGDVARYVPGFARPVEDVEHLLGRLATDDSRVVELYDNTVLPVHPATVAGTAAVLEFPPEAYYKVQGQLPKEHQVLHGSVVEKPVLSRERLRGMDLDADQLQNIETSPLATHAWVGISANPHDPAMANPALSHETLAADIKKLGYDPIEQTGHYDGEEKSYLVFGMSPDEATKLGQKYGQESVVTNSGLLYTTGPDAGQVVPASGDMQFDQLTDNYYSEVKLGSRTVKYQLPLDFDAQGAASEHPDLWAERTTEKPAKVLLPFQPGTSREQIIKTLENYRANGARNSVVYTHGYDLGGNYVPVRDHLYTDGFRTAVHRTITDDISTANGFRTFMHSDDAAGLPRGLHEVDARTQTPALQPTPDGGFVANGEVHIAPGAPEQGLTRNKAGDYKVGTSIARHFAVEVGPNGQPAVTFGRTAEEALGGRDPSGLAVGELSGSKVKFDLGDTQDLMPAVRAMDTLRRLGIDPRSFEITAGGQVIRSTPLTTTPRPTPVYRTVEIPGGYETFAKTPGEPWRVMNTTGRYVQRVSEDTAGGSNFYRTQNWLPEEQFGSKEEQLQSLILPHFNVMDQLAGRYGMQEFYLPLEAREHAPHIVAALDRFHDEFPDALREYAPTSVRVMDPTMGEEGNVAWMRWGGKGWGAGDRGVFFNRRQFTNEGLLDLTMAANTGTGWWAARGVTAPPAEYITTHELGHVLHAATITRANQVGQSGLVQDFNSQMEEMVKRYQGDPIFWRKNLSEYASKDMRELVAESYANATLSKAPLPMAEAITDQLLTLYHDMRPKVSFR